MAFPFLSLSLLGLSLLPSILLILGLPWGVAADRQIEGDDPLKSPSTLDGMLKGVCTNVQTCKVKFVCFFSSISSSR